MDLCVKTIYFAGRPTARAISESMELPFSVVETLLAFLKREKFIETVGSSGLGEQQYQYALSDRGAEKAVEALERNQYVGPTPVPFAAVRRRRDGAVDSQNPGRRDGGRRRHEEHGAEQDHAAASSGRP